MFDNRNRPEMLSDHLALSDAITGKRLKGFAEERGREPGVGLGVADCRVGLRR